MGPNGQPTLTLLSNTQAAPSGTLSGSYAQGATEGALLPSQPTYGAGANLTGIQNNIPGVYQTQYGPADITTSGQQAQSFPAPSGIASFKPPAPTPPPPGGGTGGSGGTQWGPTSGPHAGDPHYNPSGIWDDGYYAQYWNATQGGGQQNTNAAGVNINDIINAYNSAQQALQGFVPVLQGQEQAGEGAVNQSVQDITNQANTGEQQAQNTADSAIKQQSSALQTALGGNNAYAASFGSGLSSFGQGLNNQTYRSYGDTMGGIQNNLQTSLQQFENQKNSAAQWGQQQIAGLQNQLQQGLQQVALNSSMTDIQKATKVADIQQQAQAQQNAISSIVAQLQANIELGRQNTLQSAAMYASVNPSLQSNIQYLTNQFAQQGNHNVGQALPGGMPGMYGSNAYDKIYGSNRYSTNG